MSEPSIVRYLYAETTDQVDVNTMEHAILKQIVSRSKPLGEGIYKAMLQAMNENYPNPVSIYVGRGDNLVFVNKKNGSFHIFYQTDNVTTMTECDEAQFNHIAKKCIH